MLFPQVILIQQGKVVEAGSLISWLTGSENVAAAAKKVAGIKGDISSTDALDYLHGVVEIVKAAGYKGLVIVIDEAEMPEAVRPSTTSEDWYSEYRYDDYYGVEGDEAAMRREHLAGDGLDEGVAVGEGVGHRSFLPGVPV